MIEPKEIATEIKAVEYTDKRIVPKFGDSFYLHLSDLLMALTQFRTDEKLRILDYGCGGSPYKVLFPNSDYRRADFLQSKNDNLDYILTEDSRVDESDEFFDLILSTQVVEHVTDPKTYFSECYRLLKPQGHLICTTHGSFHDHGCPFDFQRWTADGLERDLRHVGFEVDKVLKITTGTRAFFTVAEMLVNDLFYPRSSLLGIILFAFRQFLLNSKTYIDKNLDKNRSFERVVCDKDNSYKFYIALLAVAGK